MPFTLLHTKLYHMKQCVFVCVFYVLWYVCVCVPCVTFVYFCVCVNVCAYTVHTHTSIVYHGFCGQRNLKLLLKIVMVVHIIAISVFGKNYLDR